MTKPDFTNLYVNADIRAKQDRMQRRISQAASIMVSCVVILVMLAAGSIVYRMAASLLAAPL